MTLVNKIPQIKFYAADTHEADFFDAQGNINSRVLFYRMFGVIAHIKLVYKKADQPTHIEKRLAETFGAMNVSVLFRLHAKKSFNSADFTEMQAATHEVIFQIGSDMLIHVIDENYALLYNSTMNDELLHQAAVCVEGNSVLRNQKKRRTFSMITHQFGAFDLEYFDVQPQEINIQMQYNNGFEKADFVIQDFLNQGDKTGIVLLHGLYGSGKTTYIRYLINRTGKHFIYVPTSLVSSLNEPDFLPFITQFRNSVLIIEDCEHLIRSRKSALQSDALVNLLSMGDGLLGDALHLKIICTFNSDLKEVDDALLRKGRLIIRYYFDKLDVEKSVTLQKSIKVNNIRHEALTLAEIYHTGNFIQNSDITASRIGFRRNAGEEI